MPFLDDRQHDALGTGYAVGPRLDAPSQVGAYTILGKDMTR
jgi:hypothetical protein